MVLRLLLAAAAAWDGSLDAFSADASAFCATQGFGKGSPYICAGGGDAGGGGSCDPAACTTGQYTFSSVDGFTINTSRILAAGKTPYRAFAYCPLCNGKPIGSCAPLVSQSQATFSFSFRIDAALEAWEAYVKLFFWTDSSSILGLLPPGAVGAKSKPELPHVRLIAFPTSDYPNDWANETQIVPGDWHDVAVTVDKTSHEFVIAVDGVTMGSKKLGVDVKTDCNGPQIGAYSFDYPGGSGQSDGFALSLRGLSFR